MGYQSFAMGGGAKGRMSYAGGDEKSNSMTMGLTDKEIDERISKAVEAEVARRLEEREKERMLEDEAKRARELEQQAETSQTSIQDSSAAEQPSTQSLPSGVLTPLLKRHRDLDDELKSRLLELENKFERDRKETQLADVLSPVSKKKTGRAYVALARAHSEKGDLQVALDLYRKAESYVPDNVKLKERIIEIEWAVKHDKGFMPSPKPEKKAKATKKKSKHGSGSALKSEVVEPAIKGENEDVDMVVEEKVESGKGKRKKGTRFGSEATNRPTDAGDEGDESQTPPKRQKLAVIDEDEDGVVV